MPAGNTQLVTTLMKWQTSGLSDREEQEFISLVKHLLSEEGVLDTEEVMEMMVEPFLVIEDCTNIKKLILPLEILKVLCNAIYLHFRIRVRKNPII